MTLTLRYGCSLGQVETSYSFTSCIKMADVATIIIKKLYDLLSGFLHMETGSLGLMDQIEAIKWVNRNVHFFGGDSSKVTLAGHSAGAADVGIHLLNPTLEGTYTHPNSLLLKFSYFVLISKYMYIS